MRSIAFEIDDLFMIIFTIENNNDRVAESSNDQNNGNCDSCRDMFFFFFWATVD